MPDVSVIVPTYCEADNLPLLVRRLAESAADARLDVEIIIVDDNSPDETQRVCEELAVRYPVRLVVRKGERGLSSAVIAGMRRASGPVLIVMDGDLSHPPEVVPLLTAIVEEQDVDFAIGSRYVHGGSTSDQWGLLRWLNSRAATLLSRPLTSVKDPMSGFFALRRATFEAVEESLDPIGYKIGLELIVKSRSTKVAEIPILFADRLHGRSKLTLREQLDYLRHLRRLYNHRFQTYSYLAQFVLVGLSGMAVDLAAFGMLLDRVPMPIARGLAIWLAMTWNFSLNRRLTFSYARAQSPVHQYVGFCLSCLAGACLNWMTSVGLTFFAVFAQNRLPAAAIGVAAGAAMNYALCRRWVFHDPAISAAEALCSTKGSSHGTNAGETADRKPVRGGV